MASLRNLYRKLRYEWQIQYLLPLLLLLPVFVLFYRDPFDRYAESGEPIIARITALGVESSRYQGRTPGLRVTAATGDGAIGTIVALPPDVEGCAIGDSIRAERKGLKLYLKPEPCKE